VIPLDFRGLGDSLATHISWILFLNVTSGGNHLSQRHTRTLSRTGDLSCAYFVLLRMGFTLRTYYYVLACALTAHFHPYHVLPRRFIFCGTFRELAPPSLVFMINHKPYEALILFGVQTFLPLFCKERLPCVYQRTTNPITRLIKNLTIVTVKRGI
jgi:hypothetical protein